MRFRTALQQSGEVFRQAMGVASDWLALIDGDEDAPAARARLIAAARGHLASVIAWLQQHDEAAIGAALDAGVQSCRQSPFFGK